MESLDCRKQVQQFGLFNFYFESLNLPSLFIGIIFAVIFIYVYNYCVRSKKHYLMSKSSMQQPPYSVTNPQPFAPPVPAQPWSKPGLEYPVVWYADLKK